MGSQDALKRFLFILTGMDLRSQVSVPNELSSLVDVSSNIIYDLVPALFE